MYHTIVFQLTEIWCLCVLISFSIAVLVDEMGFDKKKKSIKVYAYILSRVYTISPRDSTNVLHVNGCIVSLTLHSILLQDAGLELKGKVIPSGFYLEF